ncbi:MAG: hypothetical protein ACXWDE_12650, partial [Aeromicrobium sp.]
MRKFIRSPPITDRPGIPGPITVGASSGFRPFAPASSFVARCRRGRVGRILGFEDSWTLAQSGWCVTTAAQDGVPGGAQVAAEAMPYHRHRRTDC